VRVDLNPYLKKIENFESYHREGKVLEVIGNMIKAFNIGLDIGDQCEIFNPSTQETTQAEVVGFKDHHVFIMPLGETRGLGPNNLIRLAKSKAVISLGKELLGRVLDGTMQPLDQKPAPVCKDLYPIYSSPPSPLDRKRILEPLDVGIKAINGALTVGKGQRMSILAGSGVGKSVLLGMMARYTDADVNVIGLIGERGREVKEFIERDLGEEGLKKSVLVVATSDQSPLIRIRAAYIATAIAEYFREQGSNVLLLMDSLTRYAMAIREIGLSIGEPPTTKGYPPSLFTQFPKLLERAGNSKSKGSITAFYTVLVEGDDPNDPIGDTVRSIVDGHILLDRKIFAKGRYPAIDLLNSKSRLMRDIVSAKHWQAVQNFNQTIATYQDAEDLINIGAYARGSNAKIDYAISKYDDILKFLNQNIEEKFSLDESQALLQNIVRPD